MLIMQNKNDLIIFKNLETEKSNNKMCVVKRQKKYCKHKSFGIVFFMDETIVAYFLA